MSAPAGASGPSTPVLLVTGNPAKLAEARRLLPGLASCPLDLPEIQSLDLETGLALHALGGFPGPLVKWMLVSIGPEGMARLAANEGDPRATAVCSLLYTDGEREVSGRGEVEGELVLPARGEHGFGWDPVFRPAGSARTYGEMEPAEKDRDSHRGRAWRALAGALAAAGVVVRVSTP
jgi:non-canonical purine NTP pyrophosphatase (RdgB/HAM1 family)